MHPYIVIRHVLRIENIQQTWFCCKYKINTDNMGTGQHPSTIHVKSFPSMTKLSARAGVDISQINAHTFPWIILICFMKVLFPLSPEPRSSIFTVRRCRCRSTSIVRSIVRLWILLARSSSSASSTCLLCRTKHGHTTTKHSPISTWKIQKTVTHTLADNKDGCYFRQLLTFSN